MISNRAALPEHLENLVRPVQLLQLQPDGQDEWEIIQTGLGSPDPVSPSRFLMLGAGLGFGLLAGLVFLPLAALLEGTAAPVTPASAGDIPALAAQG